MQFSALSRNGELRFRNPSTTTRSIISEFVIASVGDAVFTAAAATLRLIKKVIPLKKAAVIAAECVVSAKENATPQRHPQTPHLHPQKQRPQTLLTKHYAQAVKKAPVLNRRSTTQHKKAHRWSNCCSPEISHPHPHYAKTLVGLHAKPTHP